jgi:hypothetical protein
MENEINWLIDRQMNAACAATFSYAGSSFWNHHNAQFSVALPGQTQDIL